MYPGWPNPHKSVDEIRSDQQRLREYARGLRGLGYDVTHIASAIAGLAKRAYAALRPKRS